MDAVREHMRALDPANVLEDVRAAYAWLLSDGGIPAERVAAIGWCRGGQGAFFANAHLPLRAAISMYGNRIAPDLLPFARTQAGRLLMIWAGVDPLVSPEERRAVADALTAANQTVR